MVNKELENKEKRKSLESSRKYTKMLMINAKEINKIEKRMKNCSLN